MVIMWDQVKALAIWQTLAMREKSYLLTGYKWLLVDGWLLKPQSYRSTVIP